MRARTRFGRAVGALLALLVAVGALSGCAVTAAGNEDGRKVVGLAVANLQADFFNQIRQSVQREADRRGVRLVIADAKGDPDTQVNQIQDLITRDVDAIIYIPAGATAATVPVRNASRAGIPVVTIDRNPDGAPGDTFIATDSEKAAQDLGGWVAREKGGQANIGVVQGQIGTTPRSPATRASCAGSLPTPACAWWPARRRSSGRRTRGSRSPPTCCRPTRASTPSSAGPTPSRSGPRRRCAPPAARTSSSSGSTATGPP
ncbi:hypothetical protein GCM10025872_30890 [Barrientosiimonas endolithica]|uniref:Periplasmic binding protein domain-containing protein n=1 Tax=Barrientosiimonas endolithica TaxID=1535208 RepID=A0ABM8HEJ0_9MICO|nr:hypothetical protein GCM10025872_30890 [Barrientosiimonas endolithica]